MSIRTHRLSNGIRIVTERINGLKSASIGLWIKAGGRHERAEQGGVAHFLEHMAFKGTARRTGFEISTAIEDVGGYMNAYTSREMTAYYARVLEPDVPLALDVLSDIVLNSVFEQKEMDVERGVILQEIGQSLDNPDDVIFDWLQEVAYPDQAMGRPILGSPERVSGFSREDMIGFMQEHYAPEGIILAAAGAIDHDAIVADAERHLGDMIANQPTGMPSARFCDGGRREVKDLEQVHLALALRGPDAHSADCETAQIFSTALGGGTSSKLFQKVRDERGLCYSVFSQMASYSDTGMMVVYAGTGPQLMTEMAQVIVDEIRRAAETFTEQEVNRARAQIKAGILMGQESASARAERLARSTAIWDKVPSLDDIVEKIDAVTVADLRRFGERLISGPMASVLYGAVDEAPDHATLKARLGA